MPGPRWGMSQDHVCEQHKHVSYGMVLCAFCGARNFIEEPVRE